jgi:hypothetical protein
MLKYSDLSKGQKRCIDAFVEHRPELASAETLASKDMYYIWQEIFAKRADGGPKIGYPHWLSKFNQLERGMLAFPGPNSKGTSKKTSAKAQSELEKSQLQRIIDTSDVVIDEDEFAAELKANGITV